MQKSYLSAMFATLVFSSSAIAGPNEGGVLLLHAEESLVWSAGEQFCGQSQLEDCESADVRIDGTDSAVYFLLAAFPAESSPRVMGLTVGIDYDPAIVVEDWESCGDSDLPDSDWPLPNTGIAVTWDAGNTQADLLFEVGWFAAYSNTEDPAVFSLVQHPTGGSAFGDDAIPSNIDPVAGLGSLGFNTHGQALCPGTLDCTLALAPSRVTVYQPCGGTFPIELRVDDVDNLASFDVCVGYSDAFLSFAGAVIEPFLGSTGRTVIPGPTETCEPSCETAGTRISASTTGSQQGPLGSGVLATIFFTAQDAGA